MKARTRFLSLLLIGFGMGLGWWLWHSLSSGITPKESVVPGPDHPASLIASLPAPPTVPVPLPSRPENEVTIATTRKGTIPVSPLPPDALATPTATSADKVQSAPVDYPSGLRFTPAPPGGSQLAISNVKRATYQGKPLFAGDASLLSTEPPLAIYALPLADIVNGGGLEHSLLVGFSYLVEASGNVISNVELRLGNNGEGLKTRELGLSPESLGGTATLQALQQLQVLANSTLAGGSYELRLLGGTGTAPLERMRVLWLKADNGNSDLIFPIAPPADNLLLLGGRIKAETLYDVNDYLNILRSYRQRAQGLPATP